MAAGPFSFLAMADKENFAFTPGNDEGDWKLPIHDAAHVGAAIAAIGKGFRGQKVDLPEGAIAGVKRKIRAAWKKFHPEKSNDEMPEAIRESLDMLQEDTILQEYSDNAGRKLTVDRERGIIPGVKLLGRVSKKGREYPATVIAKAAPKYEGMRVNIDHVDPGTRRSLRDRIGLVKNVAIREDGLYGDFHFNPKHALAEQIAWDAENAPQNLGFSHDTRGNSRNVRGKVVVESIDKVLSVDLVANPATTEGLFESADGIAHPGEHLDEAWSAAARMAALAARRASPKESADEASGLAWEATTYANADKPLANHTHGGEALHLEAEKLHKKAYELNKEARNSKAAQHHLLMMKRHRSAANNYDPKETNSVDLGNKHTADDSEIEKQESADGIDHDGELLQEAWSPAARAAALAARKARAKDLSAATDMEEVMRSVHHKRVSDAAEKAANESSGPEKDAWTATKEAHNWSSIALGENGKSADHKTAQEMHTKAAAAWKKVHGRGAKGMAQRHTAMAQDHGDTASGMGADEAEGAQESADEFFQEAWSEAARAAALASRRAHAPHKGDDEDYDDSEKGQRHVNAAFAAEKAAKETSGDESAAWRATRDAHNDSSNAYNERGESADHKKAAETNAKAAAAWKKVPGRSAASMAKRHATMAKEHTQRASESAAIEEREKREYDEERAKHKGTQESADSNGNGNESFQEYWSPAARQAAAEKRRELALQRSAEAGHATDLAKQKGGASAQRTAQAAHLKAAKAHHNAALGYHKANEEILQKYEDHPGQISDEDSKSVIRNARLAREHNSKAGEHYGNAHAHGGAADLVQEFDPSQHDESIEEDVMLDEEVLQETWSPAARAAATMKRKEMASAKAQTATANADSLDTKTDDAGGTKGSWDDRVKAHKAAGKAHRNAAAAARKAGDEETAKKHDAQAKIHESKHAEMTEPEPGAKAEGAQESLDESDDILQEAWSPAARAAALAARKAKAASKAVEDHYATDTPDYSGPVSAEKGAGQDVDKGAAGHKAWHAKAAELTGRAMAAHKAAANAYRASGNKAKAKYHDDESEKHGLKMLEHIEERDGNEADKREGAQESMDTLPNREREELNALRAEKNARELRESIDKELLAAGLEKEDAVACSKIFMEDIYATTDPAIRRAKIRDRSELVAETAAKANPHRQRVTAYSSSPLLEDDAESLPIPPQTAPLAQRLARFAR